MFKMKIANVKLYTYKKSASFSLKEINEYTNTYIQILLYKENFHLIIFKILFIFQITISNID